MLTADEFHCLSIGQWLMGPGDIPCQITSLCRKEVPGPTARHRKTEVCYINDLPLHRWAGFPLSLAFFEEQGFRIVQEPTRSIIYLCYDDDWCEADGQAAYDLCHEKLIVCTPACPDCNGLFFSHQLGGGVTEHYDGGSINYLHELQRAWAYRTKNLSPLKFKLCQPSLTS